jgi:apolipoprotein N-acyltransferase
MNRALAFALGHPRSLALLLGAIAATGFQPLGLWPLTLLAVAGLIELVARAASARRAVLLGWLFGLGHFFLGNNWIATAFTHQAAMPAWLGWVGVLLIALYLAVYPALAAWIAWRFGRSNYTSLVLTFASGWILGEWLRSWVFTGFSWNPLGIALLGPFDRPGIAILAREIGSYGLSGLLVILAGSWLIALRRGRIDWRGAAMLALPVALWFLPGPVKQEARRGAAYTLVQPNTNQAELHDPARFEATFQRSMALSRSEAGAGPRLILWPESGLPDFLFEGYPPEWYASTTFGGDPALARWRIGRMIGEGNLLLTGNDRLDVSQGIVVGARAGITAIDASGTVRATYDKAHLVPYGEYVPLKWLLGPLGLSRLVPGDIEFKPGPGRRTIDLGPWGGAGMLLCYEVIFSGDVTQPGKRPAWLFNPSNDGWYGAWGPPQHLAQARLRAIEEGLPVLRSTTTGISAVIDARGVVEQWIGQGIAGKREGLLPLALAPTLFARFGNCLALGLAALLAALSLVATRRARE